MTKDRIEKAVRIWTLLMMLLALTGLSGCFLRPVNNNHQDIPEVTHAQTSDDEDHTPSGSGSFFSNLTKPEHSPQQQAPTKTPDNPAEELTKEEERLVGQWACHSYGEINGQSTSDDELITFIENGTFTNVIVTSGPIINGIIEIVGRFKADGDTIYFYDCTESWEPSPESTEAAHYDEPIDDYESDYEFLDDQTFYMSYMTYEKVG